VGARGLNSFAPTRALLVVQQGRLYRQQAHREHIITIAAIVEQNSTLMQ
jgi:hypothetical protein